MSWSAKPGAELLRRCPPGLALALAVGVVLAGAGPAGAVKPRDMPARTLASGLVLPYPLARVFRGFGRCVGGERTHRAIDIGGVGEHGGLGTVVRSIAAARVTRVGRSSVDPTRFGAPDTGPGAVHRGRRDYPAGMKHAEYGQVWFFTRTAGRWRTGNLVETVVEGGPLAGHQVRYMHLAAVHPTLDVGQVVAAGQELGLMGGTGVQRSAPHVHIDVRDPAGTLLDVERLLGRPGTSEPCAASPRVRADAAPAPGPASRIPTAADAPEEAHVPRAALARRPAPTPAVAPAGRRVWRREVRLPRCGVRQLDEDFESGRYDAHEVSVEVPAGARLGIRLLRKQGRWRPKVEVFVGGERVYDGRRVVRRGGGLRVRAGQSGRRGHLAALTLKARAATAVTIRVRRWETPEAAMPGDAAYRLKLERWCRRGSRGNR